jgi:hypothetical protein
MFLVDHTIGKTSLDVCAIWTPFIATEGRKNYSSVQCRLSGEIVFFYVSTIRMIYFSSNDFYSDSALILDFISVGFC